MMSSASSMQIMSTNLESPNPDQIIGRNIRARRESLGLTQRELSARLATEGWTLDVSSIARIEGGSRALRVAQLYLVAKALDARPEDFLEDDVDRIEDLRNEAAASLRAARHHLAHALHAAEQVYQNVRDDHTSEMIVRTGTPDLNVTGARYLDWVRERVTEYASSAEAPVVLMEEGDESTGSVVEKIARALIQDLVLYVPSEGGGPKVKRGPFSGGGLA